MNVKQLKETDGIQIEISDAKCVKDLKKAYLEKINQKKESVRFLTMGKELEDQKPIFLYNLEDEFVIQAYMVH